jgi:uncharacterized metal-binding protein
MRELISLIVLWGVVPGIFLALLIFGIVILRRASYDERRTSARAGFWAGLVLFIGYVISQSHTLKIPVSIFRYLPGLDLVPAAMGFVIGFLFLWGVRFLLLTRMIGIVCLILSALSTSGLYSYIFIDALRNKILFLALGFTFGALLHIVFFPSSVKIDREIESGSEMRR